MSSCFCGADILLPKKNIDLEKWSVVACDQYTSQPDYWDEVERIVGEAPSALRVTYPEIYLGETFDRTSVIRAYMEQYLGKLKMADLSQSSQSEHENSSIDGWNVNDAKNSRNDGDTYVLEEAVQNGYILTERITESGTRLGLVGKVDLESYDYHPENKTLIRATEKTVEERIPARIGIRQQAMIELPHIMLLVDDPKREIIEVLYEKKDKLPKVYDTELMMKGGHIRGYAIEGEAARALDQTIERMEAESNGLFLVTGDGNHSLATAKVHWENIKKELIGEWKQQKTENAEGEADALEAVLSSHPARYALAEVVNLHSDALIFEPIHRLLMQVGERDVEGDFESYLQEKGISVKEGNDIVFLQGGTELGIAFGEDTQRLPVDILQEFLDTYIEKVNAQKKEKQEDGGAMEIDYIHGEDTTRALVAEPGNCGMLIRDFKKEQMFDAIEAGGVLPRKTFSVGHAHEKRYYMEARKIVR